MPKPGQMKNLARVGLSVDAGLKLTNQASASSANTAATSGAVNDANRLARVPSKSSTGSAMIDTLGRKPLPIPK